MNSSFTNTENTTSLQPLSRGKKIIKITLLSSLFLFCLCFFTLSKLPETKITGLIQGYLQSAFDPMGIYITDQGREFSVWRGFRYKLIHPTLELSDQTRIELDEITASPHFLSLLTGKMGGTIEIKQGPSVIQIDGAGRGDKVSAHLNLNQVNFGKLGLLSYFAQIKGSGIITGNMNVEGSLADPASLVGQALFSLKIIQIDEQSLMGFQLEQMKIADGTIEVTMGQGKVQFKNVKIGKHGTADDLDLAVAGDITLNRNLNASVLNMRTVLGFSDKVKQKLTLLDSIMGLAKQSDGRYAYKLTGTLSSPFPNPDPEKK